MAISIPNNNLVKPAHDFDSKPGVAKVAIEQAGPLSISSTGTDPSGAAYFEPTDGTNNEAYIGMGMIPTPAKSGIGALRNCIIGNFQGVVAGKEVFLGQDGSLTQDVAAVAAPDTAPTLTQSVGAGVLAAGEYLVSAAFVDTDGGVSVATEPVAITIVANKAIDVADFEQPLPAEVDSVNWYISDAANSETLKYVANNSGAAFSINSLPLAGAGAPLTTVATPSSRRVGVGFTPHLIAFD
jgi:hypothetical protein